MEIVVVSADGLGFENHRMTDPKAGRCNLLVPAGNNLKANGKKHSKSFAEVMVGRQRGQKALSDVVFSLISTHFVVKYFIFSR